MDPNKKIKLSISYTTRSIRKGELNGIDYFFVSESMLDLCIDADIHSNIFGSDHCPVSLTLDL